MEFLNEKCRKTAQKTQNKIKYLQIGNIKDKSKIIINCTKNTCIFCLKVYYI